MHVLAVDPGGNTGLAEWWDDGTWRAWAEPAHEAMRTVHRQLTVTEGVNHLDALIFESFIITAATAKKSQDGLVSIEFIGVGRYLAAVYGVPFVTQTPSEAKTFVTDEKLKAMDMWTRGVDHPRDATRHLMLWLCTNGHMDLRDLRHKLDSAAGSVS